jgi:hypothetical protein
LPPGRRWSISSGTFLVLVAAVAWHAVAILAQPLMLYPDSVGFVGRAYDGLHGGKVWRGDYQILPGYSYLLYWLSQCFSWPINAPLRLVQHGCLIVSHLCAYGVVRMLTRSRTFAVVVALSGLANLGFTVLGNQMIAEPIYSAAISVATLLLCSYATRPRPGLLVLAGLPIGLASLVRATGVYVALLPVLLVAVTIWQTRRRYRKSEIRNPKSEIQGGCQFRISRQVFALAGCLGLVAACVAPVVYCNRTRLHYWGLTHYLGINLYARVIEYDGVYDPDAPAQRQILAWWEQRQARMVGAWSPANGPTPEWSPDHTPTPPWRSHWPCAHLVMEEGGLNLAQADDLMHRAALEGIRKDPLGYVRRTANNLVDALAGDYRLYCYTRPDPPPAEYPEDYFAAPPTDWSPYRFNKASISSPEAARCFAAIDCYEPFGQPGVAALWERVVDASMDTYGGVTWKERLRIWAWLTIGGAITSLVLRPRLGWWLLFAMLCLHVGGAVAVEWPLPRYRIAFDMLLAVYPWLCVVWPGLLLGRLTASYCEHYRGHRSQELAVERIVRRTVTIEPLPASLPDAA